MATPSVEVGQATGESGSSAQPTVGTNAPNVTIGQATGQGLPSVSLGRATGESSVFVAPTADGGAFKIVELTGDQRELVLHERAMPYRPLTFEGKHRVSSNAYAGFPTKTQQALGAEEMSTTINGTWKDMYLDGRDIAAVTAATPATLTNDDGSTSQTEAISINAIDSARDLCELVDDIRRKGQLVRVIWAHLVRIGRLVNFKQKWHNTHDVDWEIEFDFIGRDESLKTAMPATPSVADAAKDVARRYLDLQDATAFDSLDALAPGFADAVDIHVAALQQSVLDLENAVAARANGVTTGLDAMRRAMSTCQFVEDTCDLLIDRLTSSVAASAIAFDHEAALIGERVTALLSAPPSSVDLTRVPFGQANAAASGIARSLRSARALKNSAGRQRIRIARASEADIIAIVIIRDEEDLRDLAKRYYSAPEEWTRLRKFNGFPRSQVERGTIVLIPSRRAPL